jgi:hypothetical protein
MRLKWTSLIKPKHASDQELLLLLDGELKSRKADLLRAHLAACWECRVHHDETADVIRDFVEYRRQSLSTAPPGGWPNLRHRLQQIERSQPVRTKSMWRGFGRLSPKGLVFASLCAAVLLWFRFGSAVPVSASAILDRASRNETELIRRTSVPVIHEKVVVRWKRVTLSTGQTGTLELWNAVEGGATRRTGSQELWRELEEVFQTNHMGPVRPLSATAHRAWRESVQSRREEAVKANLADGTVTWTAKTETQGPFQRNQIVEGDLTVRKTDWAPVAQKLRVQGDQEIREYEFTVVAYDVVERSSLSASFFETALPAGHLPGTGVATVPAPVAVTMAPAGDSNPELDTVYIIHRAGLCHNGAVEIKRGAENRILVEGMVDTVARRNEITALLNQIPDATVSLRSMEEAVREAAPPDDSTPAGETDVTRVTVRKARPAAASFLADYFRNQGDTRRATELANRALSLSSDAVADAWELRRLADRFAWPRPELSVVSRRRLELMIRDHLKALDATGGLLRGLLDPVLTALAGHAAAGVALPPDQSVWSDRCRSVLDTQLRIRKLVEILLVDGEGADPAAAAAELLSAFANVQARLSSLEGRLSEDFSEPDGPARKN